MPTKPTPKRVAGASVDNTICATHGCLLQVCEVLSSITQSASQRFKCRLKPIVSFEQRLSTTYRARCEQRWNIMCNHSNDAGVFGEGLNSRPSCTNCNIEARTPKRMSRTFNTLQHSIYFAPYEIYFAVHAGEYKCVDVPSCTYCDGVIRIRTRWHLYENSTWNHVRRCAESRAEALLLRRYIYIYIYIYMRPPPPQTPFRYSPHPAPLQANPSRVVAGTDWSKACLHTRPFMGGLRLKIKGRGSATRRGPGGSTGF